MSHQVRKLKPPEKKPDKSPDASVDLSKMKDQIHVIRERISKLIKDHPEKAALIITQWLKNK